MNPLVLADVREDDVVAAATRRPLILVVDDDPDMRQNLSDLLAAHAYDVVTAADGAAAVDTLRAGTAPALIVLDVIMPVSGWVVLDWLGALPESQRAPVIVFTGSGLTRGAFGDAAVIPKNASAETITRCVADTLARAAAV